jgi:hypothetical protein
MSFSRPSPRQLREVRSRDVHLAISFVCGFMHYSKGVNVVSSEAEYEWLKNRTY